MWVAQKAKEYAMLVIMFIDRVSNVQITKVLNEGKWRWESHYKTKVQLSKAPATEKRLQLE